MRNDIGIELVGVLAALLLAFLLAASDERTDALLTLVLISAAWIGIACGLCWITINAKRGIERVWSELLDYSARSIR